MDRYLKLQPLGTAGEICVGGAGVGKGYLNRPRLTKEKFVYNPYKSGERLYRSGDLARLSTNGEMEYLGRIDHQVKVRGFRIEPAEIENRLRAHQQIKDAVVLPGEEKNGAKYLCAYIVIEPPGTDTAAPENGPDFPELREYLSLTLPDYMIPAYFVMLAKIPLTANGKLDRVALPAPRINTGEAYVAPNTEIEKKLAAIWAKSLGPGGETIGSTDNFFNLGGDSIKAISLISSINEQLKTNLKLVNLYTHGTIRELAALILQESSLEANDRYDEVAKEIQELGNRIKARMKQEKNMNPDIQDAFPMSDIQKGMVFYYLKDMETNVYHDQFIYNIKYKDFDIKRFEQALTLMVKKHEILRTCLNMEDFEEPVQLVLQNINLNMEHVDISGMNTTQQEEFIKKIVDEDRRSPFKINVSPPWRMKVFTRSPENICLLFVCHHAIMDGWSIVSFWVELHNTYQEVKSDPGFAPRKLKSGYKDVIIEELIEKQRKETADYWKKELENYKRVEFPGIREKADGPRNMIVYHYEPEKEILEKLRKCAQTHNTSVKNLCIGAYIYTINMISYESDITVGIVTNNRPVKEDGGKILGCFLNTIPLRMNIPSHISWEDYIRIVENKIQEVKQYERLPLFEIARILGERNKDRNPIFDTIMNFMDFHVLHRAAMGDDWAESKDMILPVEGNFDTNTLFDFEMDITTGRLLLGPKYNPSAISQQLVAKCCLYFERILNKFTNEPTALMSKKTVIPEEEIKKLLYEFNHTAADYSQHKTMHQLFEEQVEKTPDHTSVVGPLLVEYRSSRTYMTYISYTELNKESNRLAHTLRKKGVIPGGLVAVIMERSQDMVTAVMGILKAGGAYVPLEPYLPRRRVQKILDSLEIRWVITDSSNRQDVETMAGSLSQLNHILYPDEPADAEIWENPAPMAVPGDMAYIIFTSGSTGTPKGVVETHRPVVNVIEWVNKTFNITPGDKLLFITSLGFDLSVYDIFGILASGASLRVVPSPDTKDPKRLLDVIMNEGITFWDSAPAALQQLVPFFHEVSGYSIKSRLRLVFLSGDWIPVTLPDVLRQTFTGVQVVSMGGATEATIWSNYYLIGNVHHSWPSIPYGKPMQNARYYILDKNLELSPILVPGDLYISGECLASGYINEVELTSEKFNQKLLRGVQGGGFLEKSPPGRRRQNIYKTGDMARWLADGNMEFLGRKDLQVKVRGFRIELGEIESQLLKHEEIKAGIVTARKDKNGHNYLCAYFCADRDMNNEELKEHLSGELPEYMIPTYFIQLDAVPVTANGKVDRKALPEPGLEMGNLSTAVAPRNEIEKKLAEIWREILGSGSSAPDSFISIDADFFELGGHSLNATVLIAKVHKALDVKIPLAEIFNSPTIRELARYIQKTTGNKYTAIRSVEKKEYYPVSSAQKRMYLLNRVKGKNDISDNTPGIMTAAGSLDLERVETAVRQLLKRHEVFRTSFVMLAEEPVQRVHQEAVPEFAVEYHGTASSEIEVRGITRNFVRPFDLGCAPLLRVGLAKLVEKNQNKYLVMYDMHHIIMDGNSMAIFIKEFLQLYHGLRLPRLRVQYKDFTLWQNNLLQSKSIQKQEEYWSEKFRGEIPVLALPTDFPRPLTQSFVGSRLEFQWDREITGKINRLVRESETTLFVVLLAIYTVLLSRYSDREDIVVGTPVAGRPHADLEDTMGMFVNTLALRNYPNGTKTFSQLLEEVKINSIKAFENQDHQFEHLVERLGLQRDHSRNVLFDTMLVLQNFKMDLSLNQLPIKSGNQEQDSIFSPYSFDEEISRFDITLNAIEHDNVISFIMRYSTRLFKKETMETFIRYFREIANCVVENKEIQLNEIEISHEFSDYSSAILTEAENDFEF
jgi:amino acid adenylation domain-containing protein